MATIYAFAGVAHPFLLGLLSGVGAMVPFGLIAVMLIALALLVLPGSVVAAIVVVVVRGMMSFVEDHTAKPALIRSATRLPFVWVLIGIIGGVETIGLPGLFVGPAVMAVLEMMWHEWVADDAAEFAMAPPGAGRSDLSPWKMQNAQPHYLILHSPPTASSSIFTVPFRHPLLEDYRVASAALFLSRASKPRDLRRWRRGSTPTPLACRNCRCHVSISTLRLTFG